MVRFGLLMLYTPTQKITKGVTFAAHWSKPKENAGEHNLDLLILNLATHQKRLWKRYTSSQQNPVTGYTARNNKYVFD